MAFQLFGKNKKEKKQQSGKQKPDLEVDQSEVLSEGEQAQKSESQEPQQQSQRQISKDKPEAQIVDSILLENGLHKSTVVSNRPLGKVGDKLEI